jgi:hypothetical protein
MVFIPVAVSFIKCNVVSIVKAHVMHFKPTDFQNTLNLDVLRLVGIVGASIHFDFRNPVNLIITAEKKIILVLTTNT